MKTSAVLALLPLALAAPQPHPKRAVPAPVLKPRDATLIDGKYIVKLKSDAKAGALKSAMAAFAADADFVFRGGFSGLLTSEELENMTNDPNVDFIEQDAKITMYATQTNADWGLARLSSKTPGTTTYSYDDSAGEGTCAYIIDTGIDTTHPEFEGRAKWLGNFSDDKNNTDGQGHGTHVAGTIGSKTYGVAKKAKLFAVKVLDADGSGTNSNVLAGMDFVEKDAAGQDCPKGVVVNMSLGGQTSAAINQAAKEIVDAGLFLAAAAGNENADASTSSPASEPSVCTVGATDQQDQLSTYSNYGKAVDILAPGDDIKSTWPGGKTNTISGTSMASPHIAGLAAYFLGLGNVPTKPQELCSYIATNALQGVVNSVPSSTVNKLANNGFASNDTASVVGGTAGSRKGRTRKQRVSFRQW